MTQGLKDTVGELTDGSDPSPTPLLLGEGLPDSPFPLKKFFLFPPLVGEG